MTCLWHAIIATDKLNPESAGGGHVRYDKTMNFLIFDGNPNGLIMGELSNWNGRVYKIARNALITFAQRTDAQHTGVYFLFGRDQEMADTIYVGEAEHLLQRLKQHINNREEWNDCIAVISKDDHLNKAHVKHLEYDFYQLAVQANRFRVTNTNIPTCSSVSEYDEAMLKEFIDHTRLLVNTLGYKAFEEIGVSVAHPSASGSLFIIKSGRGAEGRGIPAAEGFTVLTGSKIAQTVTPSFSEPLRKIRSRLMRDGVIDDAFTFTRDHLFSSPSTAASIVCGACKNGRTAWRNQQGQTLAATEALALENE